MHNYYYAAENTRIALNLISTASMAPLAAVEISAPNFFCLRLLLDGEFRGK
jgi:hypothetical protein